MSDKLDEPRSGKPMSNLAHDEIRRLEASQREDRAEIERLRAEVKAQADGWLRSSGTTNAALERAESAEASAERLAEMLKTALTRANAAEARCVALGDRQLLKDLRATEAKLAEAQEACAAMNKMKLTAQAEWGKAVDALAAERAKVAEMVPLHIHAAALAEIERVEACGEISEAKLAKLVEALAAEVEWRDDPDRPDSVIEQSAAALAVAKVGEERKSGDSE